MKTLKLVSSLFYFLVVITVNAQEQVSRDWTSFVQSVDISTDKEVKFKITASVKRVTDDNASGAFLWARIDTENDERGFFDNMSDRPIVKSEWETYTIEGNFNENGEKLYFGGYCSLNGNFYFDDFKLFIENSEGEFEEVEIHNSSFEENIMNGWEEGIGRTGSNVRVKEYTFSISDDASNRKKSLLISGKGIVNNDALKPKEGYTTKIGILISMLEDMKSRVESTVKDLDEHEVDYLIDEKANRIGALIYHLAAAEKFYQVYTFENRWFNEEEEKEWGVALNLDEKGRDLFQGHNIKYYLDIYNKVREKTLEELKKKDDAWLDEFRPGESMNNFYGWYHVMEHQSSHLGQILFLKKRIKPKEELKEKPVIEKKEEIKG